MRSPGRVKAVVVLAVMGAYKAWWGSGGGGGTGGFLYKIVGGRGI